MWTLTFTQTHTPPTGHTLKCLYPRSLAEAHKSASIPDIHPPSRAQHSGDGMESCIKEAQSSSSAHLSLPHGYTLITHGNLPLYLQLVTEWYTIQNLNKDVTCVLFPHPLHDSLVISPREIFVNTFWNMVTQPLVTHTYNWSVNGVDCNGQHCISLYC